MDFGKSSNWNKPEALAADDLPFRHYSLRHRAIAWISRNLFDHVTYRVRHGLIRGMKRKGGLGWMPVWLTRSAQTKEEMFWRDLRVHGLVVYDVGAFHGMLTLFFASRGARVIAWEPNEANYARLIENIRLNKLTNVSVRKLAVGSQARSGTLTYDPSMAGGGSVNSTAEGTISQSVEITTIDREIAAVRLPAPDLIKIDIEGCELEALQGARATLGQHRPALFLEMHGETMREKRRKGGAIVAFLCDAGYTDIMHVESGATIRPGDETMAAEGHLYCLCPTNISSQPQTASSES
jgi:FkbM family methyltransferase